MNIYVLAFNALYIAKLLLLLFPFLVTYMLQSPTTLQTTTSPTSSKSITMATSFNPMTTTSTKATTVTTTVTSAAQGIVPADFSSASRQDVFSDQSSICSSDTASIGIFFSTSHYLFCLYSSSYKVLFSEPDVACISTNPLECFSITCDPGRAVVGFRKNSVGILYGPCADFISEVSVLDLDDCQTISGPLQEDDRVEQEWKTWRICGGSAEDLYIVTAIHVNIGLDGINYDSITCCRVRLK